MNRLLIVDDDPAWRALYRMVFEGEFDIFEAPDAAQALTMLREVDPGVILLDLRMPRMSGLDFIQRLDRSGVKVPIVVCSGALDDGEPLAVAGVLSAPKTPDLRDLRAAIRSVAPAAAQRPLDARHAGAAEETYWRD